MSIRNMVQIAGILLVCSALLVSGGCGYKDDPVPPQTVVPEPISDLVYSLDDEGVELNWSFPVETIRGTALEEVSVFDLYRAEIPLAEYCEDCPIPFGPPIEVSGGATFDGKERRKARYVSSMLKPGYKYFFKVNTKNSWFASSADSNIVTFTWFRPAAGPAGVKGVGGDQEIVLNWDPVTSLNDGSALQYPVKYQVFRSVGGKNLEKIGAPTDSHSFIDKRVKNGQKYFYSIQSLMVYKGELINGGKSAPIAVIPVDLTPPAAPSGVNAVATGVGIKVFWDRSSAPDLGGYRVYRRAVGEDNFVLVGKVKPGFTLYVDRTAIADTRYYYAVTAVDSAVPPNESKKSKEAKIRD
ncbi:fibronectin type III domain-containing protein [Desulforhopalus singaporensis]|uniref:Fibronectin type-III domain-containing protein n=1 Tax=Desulforhopalus singaporensis TaxID=91360 RepID=A0A1H0TU96_9BACT|nr:hypothetical protein [Desulforhopalus singaporensis]SDP57461.1 hypothetical protein SAMN05660330_03246 [Desulforhopalus singaporensis]